jgi:hypothetical protein
MSVGRTKIVMRKGAWGDDPGSVLRLRSQVSATGGSNLFQAIGHRRSSRNVA